MITSKQLGYQLHVSYLENMIVRLLVILNVKD